MNENDESRARTLLNFDDAASVLRWRTLHDGVMGGVSSGAITFTGSAARFEGQVRPENRGGFASFRIDLDGSRLNEEGGIQLRVRGDGHVFKLALRVAGDDVSWQARFSTTESVWTNPRISFASLEPTWRGRSVPDARPFDPRAVRELGILIADEQFGPFAIEIAGIDAWSGSAAVGDEA
ncbi:MAG: CIA30 family protein [Planctomycetota bacterium]